MRVRRSSADSGVLNVCSSGSSQTVPGEHPHDRRSAGTPGEDPSLEQVLLNGYDGDDGLDHELRAPG